jgi:hypothetical protein
LWIGRLADAAVTAKPQIWVSSMSVSNVKQLKEKEGGGGSTNNICAALRFNWRGVSCSCRVPSPSLSHDTNTHNDAAAAAALQNQEF